MQKFKNRFMRQTGMNPKDIVSLRNLASNTAFSFIFRKSYFIYEQFGGKFNLSLSSFVSIVLTNVSNVFDSNVSSLIGEHLHAQRQLPPHVQPATLPTQKQLLINLYLYHRCHHCHDSLINRTALE